MALDYALISKGTPSIFTIDVVFVITKATNNWSPSFTLLIHKPTLHQARCVGHGRLRNKSAIMGGEALNLCDGSDDVGLVNQPSSLQYPMAAVR